MGQRGACSISSGLGEQILNPAWPTHHARHREPNKGDWELLVLLPKFRAVRACTAAPAEHPAGAFNGWRLWLPGPRIFPASLVLPQEKLSLPLGFPSTRWGFPGEFKIFLCCFIHFIFLQHLKDPKWGQGEGKIFRLTTLINVKKSPLNLLLRRWF